jgi:hypothetical protein
LPEFEKVIHDKSLTAAAAIPSVPFSLTKLSVEVTSYKVVSIKPALLDK